MSRLKKNGAQSLGRGKAHNSVSPPSQDFMPIAHNMMLPSKESDFCLGSRTQPKHHVDQPEHVQGLVVSDERGALGGKREKTQRDVSRSLQPKQTLDLQLDLNLNKHKMRELRIEVLGNVMSAHWKQARKARRCDSYLQSDQ